MQDNPAADRTGALHGVRVLDLTDGVAGQYCCRLLADHGAEVTLIEPPSGSSTRRFGPFAGESLLFHHLNTGKQSVVIEAATSQGQALLLRLVQLADFVVVEAATDRSAFAAANHRCIVGVISDFGQGGPWAEWRGSELIFQAASGVMMHNGEKTRKPLYGFSHRASYAAGTALYVGLLAAFHARRTTGKGQEVDVSIAETAATMSTASTAFAYSGVTEARNAGDHQLRCRDGWVAVWLYSHLWKGFCEAVGAPELHDDPRFAEPTDRQRNWAELLAIVQELVADRAADDLVASLQARRLIAAKAAHLTELAGHHPHLNARGFWETIETSSGPRLVVGPPFRMARTPRVVRGGAPRLGSVELSA